MSRSLWVYGCRFSSKRLVERWRPETHPFHFPIGEATVTLQDVAIIWGLPIDGDAVVSNDLRRTMSQWADYVHQYLGFIPNLEVDFRNKSAILITTMCNHFEGIEIGNDTLRLQVEQYARGCALILLGILMISDTTGNSVSLLYLQHFEDVRTAGRFSWASVVLSFLYRQLCAMLLRHRSTL
ncbi:hypothetical protein DH2020_016033 [Rehmannia glutinosa]|uniref:Aminotransferase-like plant mobile domain-containing protein n=1 Tax=Rehmannia glutinosa TaxID=99300 RepID=A0ABR0WUV0_REHGL